MLPLFHFPEVWYVASPIPYALEQIAAMLVAAFLGSSMFMLFAAMAFKNEGGIIQHDLSITRFFFVLAVLAAVFGGYFVLVLAVLFVAIPLYGIFYGVPAFIRR